MPILLQQCSTRPIFLKHESLVFVDSVDRGLILQYPFYHGMHNLRNRGREDITNDVVSKRMALYDE
jgi:hypothetical protein